jgi:metal-responsive CopG/Arc/MetJ family transcriptional regulator
MPKAKIAITLDEKTLQKLDRLVEEEVFPNRSQAIEAAIIEKLERIENGRLVRECAKLDPAFERRLAEEAISEDLSEWPEY